jgi:hypothetical protein
MNVSDNFDNSVPREEFADALAAHYFAGYVGDIPDGSLAIVFRKAWDDGHADGLIQVEAEYAELAEIFLHGYDAGTYSAV